MNRKIIQIGCILLGSFFIMACSSDNDCDCTSTKTAESNESISQVNFQEGLITKDITIDVKTEDEELLGSIILKKDTQFEDKNGVAVTETPILHVDFVKKEETMVSRVKFTDKKGNVITPTKAFKVLLKAPAGAEPGDQVKVEVPDNTNIQIQKTIIRIVDANGFLFIEITINDNKNATVEITITLLGNTATN